MDKKPLIYDLDKSDIQGYIAERDEPGYRADQIWEGLYQRFVLSPAEFSNLPKSLIGRLDDDFSFSNLQSRLTQQTKDGQTVKTLFALPDGNAVEAVLMTYNQRNTLCISTQSGCAMGCVFCATGQMGFKRNLTSGEIVEQVLHYARILAQKDRKVTNIVLMGMGEPFHNYDQTMQAIDRLNAPKGFGLGARRFTISTVGLVPGIRRLTKEKRQVNLAISLHAADDELRASMLPVNSRYPIRDLIEACREYVAGTGRRVTFEWALIDRVNDTPEQAYKLVSLLEGILCHVNVIPLNPTTGFSGRKSTRENVEEFKRILTDRGIPCTVRVRRGVEIQAGCGQLASEAQN
ncbi:MAG: 23S rRNA (adenine(2503)-C(2))-methyltransferase RlmN [Chloroflexi bacterium]|nr:23S rRNA (adenine(2503)-C(2))-methyltransferase RlmN [Chloroflexota bacterium]